VIDLHLHTTASDGRLSPRDLVARAAEAGLTTISVTDHDTVAAIGEVTSAASARAIRVIPGIEITSVHEERDVHVLGYFFDYRSAALARFLEEQRGLRVSRVREIGLRLAALNVPVDVDETVALAAERPGTSIGRPWLARALVAAGHAASVSDAFERYLGHGRPAFVPRTGCSPSDAIRIVHDAGGIVSFAHPGVTDRDQLLAPLADAGLDAIEAHHSDHLPEVREQYVSRAQMLGVGVSGGSDYHGPGERRAILGAVTLPPHALADLESRAATRRAAVTGGPR
jgi:predicted metal-dependent phosphoesterase TrpH